MLDVCGLYTEEINARILRKGREDMGGEGGEGLLRMRWMDGVEEVRLGCRTLIAGWLK